jgi:hypothetical protein
MSQQAAIFLRLDQEVRGPYGLEVLLELAQNRLITPDTEASLDATGPWIPIETLGDFAKIFPVRRQYRFKKPSFKNANRSPHPPVDHREIIAAANRPVLSRSAVQPLKSTGTSPPNDVEALLRENARLRSRLENILDLKPRPNRRRLDYIITMLVFNGFFIWRLIEGRGSPTSLMFGLGGIVAVSAGITWVMYGVMDRY